MKAKQLDPDLFPQKEVVIRKRYSCNSLAEFRDLVLYSSTLTKIIPGTNMIIY